MHSFARILRFAIQNFMRNAWLSVVTISVLVICLIAVNVMISVGYIKGILLSAVYDRVNVTVNLNKGIGADEVQSIADDLNKQPKIATITVVTPEESLADFKLRFPDESRAILPVLDGNPLSFKLKIRMTDLSDYANILTYLKQATYKDKIQSQNFNDYRTFIQQAVAVSDNVNKIAFGIAFLFLALGVLVVINTIRVSIYTQREEVGIMKLVGATNWFVQAPFLVESVFYSLTAVLISFIIIYPLLQLFSASAWSNLGGLPLNLIGFYQRDFWLLFAGQFLGLVVINGLSSYLALRRYLKI